MSTKINIISGFLGAGKTTLIKRMLALKCFDGEKLVLLENEYGEVGVDGAFMRESGIQISEINSGCICCTLAGDFHDAIIELIEKYGATRIIIEPSGVGKLSEVRNVIAGLAQEQDIILESCATVADVNRCRVYARNFGEFFTDQISSAESVVLSRTQMSTPEKLNAAVELIRSINPAARIVTTPWDELSAETMLSAIISPKPLIDEYIPHDDDDDDDDEEECHCGHHHHHHDHDDDHDEHDEHECCHHHHDHDDDDDDHDEHEHEHEHHHHHHHHHHDGEHDADEVFENIGVETTREYTAKEIETSLNALHDVDRFGSILRAKGVVRKVGGGWIHFDYVPGSADVRDGGADYTGRVCVIGVGIDEAALKGLFSL